MLVVRLAAALRRTTLRLTATRLALMRWMTLFALPLRTRLRTVWRRHIRALNARPLRLRTARRRRIRPLDSRPL